MQSSSTARAKAILIFISYFWIQCLSDGNESWRKRQSKGERRSSWPPLKWRDVRKASRRQSPRGLQEVDSRLLPSSLLSPSLSYTSITVWTNANSCYLLHASSAWIPMHHHAAHFKAQDVNSVLPMTKDRVGKWDSDDNDYKSLWMISLLLQS